MTSKKVKYDCHTFRLNGMLFQIEWWAELDVCGREKLRLCEIDSDGPRKIIVSAIRSKDEDFICSTNEPQGGQNDCSGQCRRGLRHHKRFN